MEKTSLVRFANADDTSTSTEARSIPIQGVCDIASTCASRQKANYRNIANTDLNSLSLVVKSPWPHRTAHLSATPTQRLSDIVTAACDQLGIPFGPSPEVEISVYGPDLRELPLDSNLEAALLSCASGTIGSSGAIISIDSRSSKNKTSSGTFAGGDGIDAPSLRSLTSENGQLCLYLLPYKVLWEQYWQGTGGALNTTRTTNAQASDKSLAGDATLSVPPIPPASTAPPSRSASENQISTSATPTNALTSASPSCSGAPLGPQEEPEWLPLYWHLWMSDPDHTVDMLAAPPDGCPPVSFVHDADTPLSVSLGVFATWMGIPSLQHLSRRLQEPAVTQATEHRTEVSEPLSDANRLAIHVAECANGNGSNGEVKHKAAVRDAGYGEGRTRGGAPLDTECETQQPFTDDALEAQPAAAAAQLPQPEASQKTESSNLEHQLSAQSQQLQRDPFYQQHEHLQHLQQQSCDVPASTQASGCGSWCREWLRGGGTRMLRLLAAATTTSSVASSVSDVGSGNGSIAAGGVGSERSARGSGSGSGSESGCKPSSGITGPASGAGGGQASDVAHCGGAGRCCANGGARSAMGRVCHGGVQDLDSGGPGGDAGMGSESTAVVTSAAGCCGSSTSAITATFPALHLLWLNRQVSYDASPADLGMCDQSVVALLNLCDKTDCAACLMTRGSLCGNLELIEAALAAGGLGPLDEQQQPPGLAVSPSHCNSGTVAEAAGGPGEGGGGNAVNGDGSAAVAAMLGKPRVECGAANGCRPPMLMPLGMAAANGHEAALELLLNRKVDDPNVCDKFGLPALWFAVEHGQPGCVRLLLHSGARAADWVFAAPAVAAAGAQLAAAAAAVERAAAERATAAAAAGLPVAVASYMGLCHAVEVGNVQTVRELLRFGACPYTPDDSNGTPYHMAIERGDVEIVEALLDGDPAFEELQRAQADSYRRLLHASQRVERSEVAGCPCVQCNYRVAIRAAASSETEELRAQLQLVALPTIMDAAPPEAAVSLMALMKQRGALLDAHDADGYTALHLAVRAGNLAAIRWLLQNGADPQERDALGYMPLHLLAHYGCSAAPPPTPQSQLPAAVGTNAGAQVTASGKFGTATASPDASDAAVMAASGGQLELAAARLLVEDGRMPLGAKTTCFAYEADVRTEEKKLRSAPVGGVSSGSSALTRGGRRGGGSSATAKKRSRDPMLTVPLYGGHTAAQLALRYGRPLLLAYLLHRGAPLDLSSATSRHCLEKALEAGHSAAARILLSYVQQGKTSSTQMNGSATAGTSSSATAPESKKANARTSKRSGGGSTAASAAGGSGGGKGSPLYGDRWQKTATATESTPSGAAVAVVAACTANGMSQVQVQAGGPIGQSSVTSAEPDRAANASEEEAVTALSAEAVSGTAPGGSDTATPTVADASDGASALLLERRKARRTGAGFAVGGTGKYGNEGGSGASASSVAEDAVGKAVSVAAALPAQEGSTLAVVPSTSTIHSAAEGCMAQSSTADSTTLTFQVSASPIAKASSTTRTAASFSPAAPVAPGAPAGVPATDQSAAAASTGALTRDVRRAAPPRATVTVIAAGKAAEETRVITAVSSTNISSGNSSNRMSGAVCSGGEGSGDGGVATDNANGSKSSRAARRRAARREARMAAATAGAVTGTAAAVAPLAAASSGAPGTSNAQPVAPNEANVVEASAGTTGTADESSAGGRTVNDGTRVSGGVVAAERSALSSPSSAPVAAAATAAVVSVTTVVNNSDLHLRLIEPHLSQKSDNKSSATAVAAPSVPVVPTSRSTDVPVTLVLPVVTTNDNGNMAGKEQPASDALLVHVPVNEQKSALPHTCDEVSRGSLQPSGVLLSGAAAPTGKLSYCAVSAGISGLGTPVKVESGESFSGIAGPATDEGGEWQVVTGHRHRRGPMGPPTIASEQAAIPPPHPAPQATLSAVLHSACPAQQQQVNVRQVVGVSSCQTSPQRMSAMVGGGGGDSSPRPGPVVKNSASPSSYSSPSSSRAVITTISVVPTAVKTVAVAVPFSIPATSNSTVAVASSASSTTGPSVLSTSPSPLPHSLRGSAMRRISSSSSATGGGNGAAAGATGGGSSDVCGYIEVPRSLLYGKRGPVSQSPTASTSAPAWTTSSLAPSPTVMGMAAATPATAAASPQPSVKPAVVLSSTMTVSPVKPLAVAMLTAPPSSAPSMTTGPAAASTAPSFAAAVKGEACSGPPSLTPTPPHSVNAAASGLGPTSKSSSVPATVPPMPVAAAAPGRAIDTASLRLARGGNKPAVVTALCNASPAGAVGLLSSTAESPCARRASSAGSVGTIGGNASTTTPQPPLSASKLNPKAHEFVPVRVTVSYNSTSACSATKPTAGPACGSGNTAVHVGVPSVQISAAARTDDSAACRTFVASHMGPIAKAAMRTASTAPPPPPRTTVSAGVTASLLSPSPAPPPSWMPPTDPSHPRGVEHGAHVYSGAVYGTPGVGPAATPPPPVASSPLPSRLHPSLQVSASPHHHHHPPGHQPPASPVAQVMSWQAVQPIQVLSSPIRRLPDLPDLYRAMVSPYCSYIAPSPRNASSAGAAAAAAAAAAASAAVSASAAAVAAANAQAAAAEAHAAATHHHHHQQQHQHLDSESTSTAAAAASSAGFSSGSATGSSGGTSPEQHRSRLHDVTAPPYNPLAAPLPQLSMLPHGLYCGEHLIRPTSTRLWGLDPLQQLRATQTSLDATIAAAFGVPGYLTMTSSAPPMVDGGSGGGGGGGGFTGGLVPGGGGGVEGPAVHSTMMYTMSGANVAAEGRFTGSGDDDVASDVGRMTGDGMAHHERLSGRSSGGGTGSGGVCSGIVRSLHSIFAEEELDEQRLVRQHEAAPAGPAPPSVGLSGVPYPPAAGTRCSRGPSPPLPPESAHQQPRYIAVHPPQPPVRMLPPMPYLHHQMHPRPPMLDESVWPPLRGGLPPPLPHGMMLPFGNDWRNGAIALFSGACTATTPGAAQPAVAAAALWWTAVRQAPEPQPSCTDDPPIVPHAGGGSGRASRANSCSDLPLPPPLSQHPPQHTSQSLPSGTVRHGPGRCAIMGRGLRHCGSSDGSSGGSAASGGGGRGPQNRLMMAQKVQLMGPLDTESMIAACLQGRLGPHTEVCGTVAGMVGPPPLELFEPLGALLGALQGGCRRYMLVERW